MRDDNASPEHGLPTKGKSDAEFLSEMRARYTLACDATDTLYKRAAEHMRFAFVPGSQWDSWMSESRRGRPQYEVNKLR